MTLLDAIREQARLMEAPPVYEPPQPVFVYPSEYKWLMKHAKHHPPQGYVIIGKIPTCPS